jgi:hypothetical protein
MDSGTDAKNGLPYRTTKVHQANSGLPMTELQMAWLDHSFFFVQLSPS